MVSVPRVAGGSFLIERGESEVLDPEAMDYLMSARGKGIAHIVSSIALIEAKEFPSSPSPLDEQKKKNTAPVSAINK